MDKNMHSPQPVRAVQIGTPPNITNNTNAPYTPHPRTSAAVVTSPRNNAPPVGGGGAATTTTKDTSSVIPSPQDYFRSLQKLDVKGQLELIDMLWQQQQQGGVQAILNFLYETRSNVGATVLCGLSRYNNYFWEEFVYRYKHNLISRKEIIQLDELMVYAPQLKDQLLKLMYEERSHLPRVALLSLLRQSVAIQAAPTDFREIFDDVWRLEKIANKVEPFVISIPVGVQCNPPYPVSSLNSDYPNQPQEYSPLHFLTHSNNYSIKITGDFSPSHTFYISLTTPIDHAHTAAITLTTPTTTLDPILVGHIHNRSPSFRLFYPFPVIGFVPSVVISITIKNIEEVLQSHPQITTTTISAPNDGKLVVCHGEVHQLEVKDMEKVGDILERAARRFGVGPSQGYEIQDINFNTFRDTTTFKEYHEQGGSHVVRLVRKATIAGPPPYTLDNKAGGAQAVLPFAFDNKAPAPYY